ncbi:MAG TPA: SDR family oxidoreductase [Pyrinomonadaceae bacterium]|jgi:UDP-glucose 4-epimerase
MWGQSKVQTNAARCLVTGGAGFIGSHLVERLLKDGHRVTVLDNFSTGSPDKLAHLHGQTGLEVCGADVADYDQIKARFEGVDWVFHLAALADIVPSIQRPLDYHRANVDGTIAVLEAARAAGARRFLYTASSSCYGIPDQYPTPESAAIRPEYPYALTKYLGEQYTLHWQKVYKLPCVSLRLFNVYGPRSRTSGTYGAVFGVFLAQKLAGKPYTVVGDGQQTRDFTFVTDVVDAFVRAAQSEVEGEIFNVGSDNTYSVNSLVKLLGGEVVHLPKRPGEPDCTHADISKISRMLGWRPRVSFEEGVRAMLDNIELWREAPVWDKESIADATRDWFTYLGTSSQVSQPDAES